MFDERYCVTLQNEKYFKRAFDLNSYQRYQDYKLIRETCVSST